MRIRHAALAGFLLAATAQAAPPEPAVNDPESGFVVPLRWENDAAFSGLWTYADSDRYYSAAVRVGRFLTPLRSIDRAPWLLGAFGRMLAADRIGWGATPVALDIYTPGDITRTGVIPGDRPYAGWLRTTGELRMAWDGAYPLLGRLAFSLGVVGPLSLGEQAQRGAHEVLRSDADDRADPHTISCPDPAGWTHQAGRLGSLPVAQVTAGLEQRLVQWRHRALAVSLAWNAALEAGRAEVSAGVGGTVRAGLMGTSFGDRTRHWEVVVFGRVQGRFVAWNLFLAGGGGSHGVEAQPFVLETEWGLSLRWRRVFLHWSVLSWSREFARPPAPSGYWQHLAGRDPWFEHRFGRMEIGWLW